MQVKFDFQGCNYAVTGASSGMGREVARQLALAGGRVLAIARTEARLQELQREFPEMIIPAAADVRDIQAMTKAVAEFVQQYGKLQGAVHGAGIVGMTPLQAYDKQLARDIMDISFWGGMEFLQLVTKRKYSEDKGSFVVFSSVSSVCSAKGMFAYNAAKAALNSGIATIAQEISRRKQRANCILPGWVRSPMTEGIAGDSDMEEILSHELLGEGSPENVAGMVLFLLSDSAAWITGTAIPVDGGFLCGW